MFCHSCRDLDVFLHFLPFGRKILTNVSYNRGNSYLTRFQETGDLQDIDRAISHYQKAVEPTPSGDADLPDYLSNLGSSYVLRFEHVGDLQDIDHAIFHHQRAVESTPSGHVDLPDHLNNLGTSYLQRFEHKGDFQDLDYAITYHQRAVDSTPSAHANLPIFLSGLGNSYFGRFKHTGNPQDVDHAMCYYKRAVESTPPHHVYFPSQLNNLGNSYFGRFEHTGDLQDIVHAINYYQRAVESTPSSHPDLPSWINNLGNSYFCHFEHTGNLQDVHHAISHHQRAVESTPSGHANLPGWLNNLGNSYSGRFKHTGNLEDINHAISFHQRAVESTPPSHANLPIRLNNLGNSYLYRFEQMGDLKDINHAISHHQRAIGSTPSGHSKLSNWFHSLGTSYSLRFQHMGDLQDIDHAIFYHQKTVESTTSGHADLPSYLNHLGNAYLGRFEHTGNLQDIENAISHHQRAVASTPSDHAYLPGHLNNLGNSYLGRFKCTGHLQDINHAISHHQRAVESTPSTAHADISSHLNNVGNSYLRRFEHMGDLKDIDHAISYHQRAIKYAPSGHANLPNWFNSLGNSYLLRFKHMSDLQDIEHAIFHYQKAVDSTSSTHSDILGHLNNLGNSYLYRFEHSGDLQDVDLAISHQQRAMASTPSGHANLSSRCSNLGNSYALRFQSSHYPHDILQSITSYRLGAQATGAPSIRLRAAKEASRLSSVHDHDHCLEDFALAIGLLSEVAGLEQTIHHRHANLHGHSGLVQSAVATALHHDEANLALEWLEQGRCLVWNQLIQLRTPIDDLRVRSSSLADRFLNVTNTLESYGTRSSSILFSDSTLMEDIQVQDKTRNHTILAAEYQQLLKEIRALPEFHNFLKLPIATSLLSSVPPDGPVIIFNVDETRCDALALITGINEPLHIPLDNFSSVDAEKLWSKLQSNIKQREVEDVDRAGGPRPFPTKPFMALVLKDLWYKVVHPVLEALGYSVSSVNYQTYICTELASQSCPNPSDRRRIWWCPTGPLAFLPLHAAGIYDSSYEAGQRVSDFVVSSYTPTINSLNMKFNAASSSSKCPSLLLISQTNTPGLLPIPATRKETHDIKSLTSESGIDVLLLEGAEATTDKVKTEMKARNWVHFACHGIQDVSDPLKSGVHLHDGRLELLEIMRQHASNPDLAFLSACQTSKGDLKLSEEVVHIAAGMLAAGYHGVVGTMWNISDRHGPEFATEFYKYLLTEKGSEGLDSTRAAYALDHAVKKVRESLGDGDNAFLTWVPYVHFGY